MATSQKANFLYVEKKKGPAEAATSPDHGSTNPSKGMEMNKHVDTTAAAGAATEFPIPYFYQEPGDDLRDAMAMMDALDHLWDRGCEHGLRSDDVSNMSTIFSMARELLKPVLRYLDDDTRTDVCERYRAARRAVITKSYKRGQA
jgi:hypothetical protein